MVIVVADGAVHLDEPEDCGAFKVVVEHGSEDEARTALAAVGRMPDRDTAWIRVDAVEAKAAGRVGDGWADEFATMLEFAATKGWLSDDRTEIQAHVEWSGA